MRLLKIILKIFLAQYLFVLFSCEGPLWDGAERSAKDTANITIVINDPLWDAYMEWIELNGEL